MAFVGRQFGWNVPFHGTGHFVQTVLQHKFPSLTGRSQHWRSHERPSAKYVPHNEYLSQCEQIRHHREPCFLSYTLRYIVGYGLVETAYDIYRYFDYNITTRIRTLDYFLLNEIILTRHHDLRDYISDTTYIPIFLHTRMDLYQSLLHA